jgi:hypothetical protein
MSNGASPPDATRRSAHGHGFTPEGGSARYGYLAQPRIFGPLSCAVRERLAVTKLHVGAQIGEQDVAEVVGE